MQQERSGQRSRARVTMGVVAGIAVGVALTLVIQRPAPVAFVGPGAAVTVTDADGRSSARVAGDPLHAGDVVRPDGEPATITTTQSRMTLQPDARLVMTKDVAAVRLEQGAATIDATASVEEIRIATSSGDVIVSKARVDVLVTNALAGGGTGVAFVRVEQGNVRLEGGRRQLSLGAGEGGILTAGRAPVRTPRESALALLPAKAEPDEDSADEGEPAPEPRGPQPTPVVVPVAVPVAVPVPVAVAPLSPGAAVVPVVRGSITGVVELEGTPPKDESPPATCGEVGERPWIATGGRLANVHVQVQLDGSVALPPAVKGAGPVALTKRGCAFMPHLLAIHVGDRVELRGGDDGGHGLRIADGAKTVFDATLTPGGRPASWSPAVAGVFRARCQQHPFAEGHVVVSPHPWFAVTGADGTFTIAGVPAGRHTLRAWHARGGERTASVTVGSGEGAVVRFTYEGERPAVAIAPPVEPEPARPAKIDVTPADDGACRVATGGSVIARACAMGGVPRARAAMKEIVHAARVRGVAALTCKTCHADTATFALAPLARERLAQVFAAFQLQEYAVLEASMARGAARATPPERRRR